jgi:hypothetical protein
VAAKLRFRGYESGSLSGLLDVRDAKAVIFYTQPELKMLYNFFKNQGVLLEQKPYGVAEAIGALEKNGVHIKTRNSYSAFLGSHARSLRQVTNQFKYLILGA